MTFTRLEPWALRDLVNRDVDKRRIGNSGACADDDCAADWAPAVDIVEASDHFLMRADVPGVDPADIDVSIDKDILCISGERNAVAGAVDARKRIERATGRFSRRFALPAAVVDAQGVEARCSNGILEVVIPKSPAVRARRITVSAA